MLTQERHLQILAQLEEKGTVSVAQLTQLLGASESTVRRDLIALDRLGKLHKVHGGATLTRRDFIRREEKLDEKLQLHMDYNFSKCFIGTNGIAIRQGFTTPDTDEAYLKAAAMERSFVSYVLADASKFDKVSTVSFAPLDQAAIITDRLPDPEYGERTVVKEVALL